MSTPRAIKDVFLAQETSEGAGAKVRRSIGSSKLKNFSPFLLLDHFSIGEGAGFPDHPHSGQETITYVLSGQVNHEDFTGSAGTIKRGDLQFMTAGKGIVHAEVPPPKNEDGSPNTGLQLWVDLAEDQKMCEPRYRDLKAKEIPTVQPNDKVDIKIISGESHGIESVKELAYTPVWLFDMTIQPGGKVNQPLPEGFNAFAYVLEGNTVIADKKVDQYNIAVFEKEGSSVDISVSESEGSAARVVLVAGQPHDQPVVQWGPFVQTSKERIYQVLNNYQTQSNGFERLRTGWRSKIGEEMMAGQ